MRLLNTTMLIDSLFHRTRGRQRAYERVFRLDAQPHLRQRAGSLPSCERRGLGGALAALGVDFSANSGVLRLLPDGDANGRGDGGFEAKFKNKLNKNQGLPALQSCLLAFGVFYALSRRACQQCDQPSKQST